MVAAHASREVWFMVKPELAKDVGVDSTFLGTVDSVFLFTYGLGYFVSGVLGDRFGLIKVMTSGMIGAMIIMFLVAFVGSIGITCNWLYLLLWAL